jgi:hypothetical protein
MPGLQSMSSRQNQARRRRFLFRLIGLIALVLVLQAQGDRAHAALPSSTVTLTMSNPDCVQAEPKTAVCSIQFNSLAATGSNPTLSRVEVLIGGKLRFEMAGFFESTAILTNTMIPGGLKVACGVPNASGLPNYGKVYLVTANAYMADGTSASASANVACPAYTVKNYLPLISKK